MCQTLERSRYLPDAAGWIFRRPPRHRIMVNHRPQDERVVGIQPERNLLAVRALVDVSGRERVDVLVQTPSIALERAIVDVAVANIRIEHVIKRSEGGRLGHRQSGQDDYGQSADAASELQPI